MRRLGPLTLAALSWAACTTREAPPADLSPGDVLCAFCRMPVSDPGLAAQIAAPGEEPRFFDDLGCLGNYSSRGRPMPEGSVLYVADHRTKAWIRADRALYTRCPGVETPMGSHLLAHADAASRDNDPAARGGTPVAFRDTFRVERPDTSPTSTPAPEAGEVMP